MSIHNIHNDIQSFLKNNADEAQVTKYSRYFKEGFDAYGVHQDILFNQRDVWLKKYSDELGLEGFIELGNILFNSTKYEEGTLAILFLLSFKKQFTNETLNCVSNWLDFGVRNWAHTDYICGELMTYLFKKNLIQLNDLSNWRFADSKWKRRAVPVSMLVLLKLTIEYKPYLEFIDSMMLDKERVVHQGLGWFLREMWKKQPEIVEPFLLKWKDTAARLIFQYATEKMTKEQKERFKAEKKKK